MVAVALVALGIRLVTVAVAVIVAVMEEAVAAVVVVEVINYEPVLLGGVFKFDEYLFRSRSMS